MIRWKFLSNVLRILADARICRGLCFLYCGSKERKEHKDVRGHLEDRGDDLGLFLFYFIL